jgi:DNA-directed RNA polymerase subunit RPC12/RpoP
MTNSKDDVPVCARCGKPMRLIAALPAEDALPRVESYKCQSCGEEYTREVE